MCNIAGYVGSKPAAPILIEMMRRQEGLDAGFYTGIATIHEGKIYYEKVVGDLETLLTTTDAASLPGTIGIIHSRTPGGQGEGREWGHPFTTIRDGIVESAYIANGTTRFFNPLLNERIATAERLRKDGYEFKSSFYCPDKSFKLSDDTTMHGSDVMCQLITSKIHAGADTITAMADAFLEMPGEIVALFLSLTVPDGISWARMNFPMHINFVSHGAYMATAPLAFPEDAGEPQLLPAFSSGILYKDQLTLKPFKKAPATLSPLDSRTYRDIYNVIYERLHAEGGTTLPELAPYVRAQFEPADLLQDGSAAYRVLYDINKKEPIKFEVKRKPGKYEGLTAPVFYMSL